MLATAATYVAKTRHTRIVADSSIRLRSAFRSRTIGSMTHALLIALLLVAAATGAAAQGTTCTPTPPDMLGPFYKPNAPERARTGSGIVVSGFVRSAKGCAALPGAQVEWWSADERGEYRDELRATQRADAQGRFSYETVSPGRYPGRPPHLHVRITAPNHKPLVTQLYPTPNQHQITTDFVLLPN
ncbi:MAG TPA: intradiol ring-cleavage dioxygenase [Methylomirabilota bacterium]|nr:intradiol ring-cleavage dioxygenase [Methylomirabilota bacterium]